MKSQHNWIARAIRSTDESECSDGSANSLYQELLDAAYEDCGDHQSAADTVSIILMGLVSVALAREHLAMKVYLECQERGRSVYEDDPLDFDVEISGRHNGCRANQDWDGQKLYLWLEHPAAAAVIRKEPLSERVDIWPSNFWRLPKELPADPLIKVHGVSLATYSHLRMEDEVRREWADKQKPKSGEAADA